jgi:hypothetical protein
MDLEHMLDEHTMLLGSGRWIDDGFDHDFGFEKRMAFQLERFQVVTWISGTDYDITKALEPEIVLRWRQMLLNANDLF